MTQKATRAVVVDRTGGEAAPVVVKAIPWWRSIAVRAARTYCQSLVGLLAVSLVVPAGTVAGDPRALGATFGQALAFAAVAALAPTVVAILQNAGELLARLDATQPGLRA